MKVFVDTGGWISVAVKVDVYYQVGSQYYKSLIKQRARLFTSDYVLDETITRIRYDAGHSASVDFLDFIAKAVKHKTLTILYVDEAVWNAAEDIFRRYQDQRFSFTDCTSFVLAKLAGADEIFSFDQNFLMFGLIVKPVVTKRRA